MEQLTVKELYEALKDQIKKGNGDKFLITADDVEGNGYHGLWFSVTSGTELGKYTIISDSVTQDLTKLICIG